MKRENRPRDHSSQRTFHRGCFSRVCLPRRLSTAGTKSAFMVMIQKHPLDDAPEDQKVDVQRAYQSQTSGSRCRSRGRPRGRRVGTRESWPEALSKPPLQLWTLLRDTFSQSTGAQERPVRRLVVETHSREELRRVATEHNAPTSTSSRQRNIVN